MSNEEHETQSIHPGMNPWTCWVACVVAVIWSEPTGL
jgi:hypothetical protein